MFIDTHCHITLLVDENVDRSFSEREYETAWHIISQAKTKNITTIITIGSTNLQDSVNCCLLAKNFSSVYAAIGIFPHDSKPSWKQDLQNLIPLLKEYDKIVAIGECGLDFHYPDFQEQRQKDVFKAQIELALEYNKALIIHTRQAPDQTLRIVDEFKHHNLRGVFHCFSEDLAYAQYVISLGFYIGIPATITYPKNNRLREIVSAVGLNNIVLETDAPFLPPQHMRGKQNHPEQIATIAEYISQMLSCPIEEIAKKTTHNAQKLFQLK